MRLELRERLRAKRKRRGRRESRIRVLGSIGNQRRGMIVMSNVSKASKLADEGGSLKML